MHAFAFGVIIVTENIKGCAKNKIRIGDGVFSVLMFCVKLFKRNKIEM